MTRIVTISVKNEDILLLNDRKISPSALFRDAVERVRHQTQESMWLDSAKVEAKISVLVQKLEKYSHFLDKNKLLDKFLTEERERDAFLETETDAKPDFREISGRVGGIQNGTFEDENKNFRNSDNTRRHYDEDDE
jgi:hypothetical protein